MEIVLKDSSPRKAEGEEDWVSEESAYSGSEKKERVGPNSGL